MHSICYIVGAAPCEPLDFTRRPGDLVIAADGGGDRLRQDGIAADIAVGDFDSLQSTPCADTVLRHPPEKDDTDMMLAVREGLARGYRRFVLYGGLGGRLDHTLANIQVLAYLAEQGARGYLVNARETVTVLADGGCQRFDAAHRGMLTVLSLSDRADGISLVGLKYAHRDLTMYASHPLGVSNEFIGEPAAVSVETGKLVLLWHRTDSFFTDISQ